MGAAGGEGAVRRALLVYGVYQAVNTIRHQRGPVDDSMAVDIITQYCTSAAAEHKQLENVIAGIWTRARGSRQRGSQ